MASYTQLIQTIKAANEPLFKRFEPAAAINLLDGFDEQLPYHYVSEQLQAMWDNVGAEFGSPGFGAFQKTVMLNLMSDFEKRAQNLNYVDEVVKFFEHSYIRITSNIENTEYTGYNEPNDLFLKDLALCRQKLFSAGPQVVEANSGFHRALMFRKGFKQAWQFMNLLRKTGGHTDYYQYHTHLGQMDATRLGPIVLVRLGGTEGGREQILGIVLLQDRNPVGVGQVPDQSGFRALTPVEGVELQP